jgi:lipid-A-disaccharide synthase
MPVFIKAAELLNKNYKVIKFYIVTLPEYKTIIMEYFKDTNLNFYITCSHDERYNIYSKADFALCASGTVTMELAKASTAMLVVYKLHFITWFILKAMVKVKTATIINILLKENVIPELFQQDVNEFNIHRIIKSYLDDDNLNKIQIKKLKIAINELKSGTNDPSYIAAKSVLSYININ